MGNCVFYIFDVPLIIWKKNIGGYNLCCSLLYADCFFIFLLNLINNRTIKWLILFFLFVLPISLFIYNDNPNNDFTLMYIIIVGAPADIPILPDNIWDCFRREAYQTRLFYEYLVYFILPVVYWIGLYFLSKTLISQYFNKTVVHLDK